MSKARKILGANLSRLMASSVEYGSAPAVERATAEKGQKVGRSTVQRVKDAETTVNLDYIDVFAKVFRKEPWELLHPAMGEGNDAPNAPSLPQALEVVIAAITPLTQPDRKALAEDLALLAVAPGDAETKQRVMDALQAAPAQQPRALQGIAGQVVAKKLDTETGDFVPNEQSGRQPT
jgi:hypothetical protein